MRSSARSPTGPPIHAILNTRMGARTGSADLPLHGGRVPEWLAGRMARLGRVLVEAIVHEYGRRELLRRLSSPFWFQSPGCVMGMDWHSSGSGGASTATPSPGPAASA